MPKKGTYTSQYSCKHVGIRVNLSRARICALHEHHLGYHYRALTRLRYQTFEIHLDDEPQVGMQICQSLIETCEQQ